MRIPERVNVAGHIVRVECRDYVDRKNKLCVGRAFNMSKHIILGRFHDGRRICKSETEESFIHELLHHIDYKYNVKLKESQVNALASGIYQVFKDNKLRF